MIINPWRSISRFCDFAGFCGILWIFFLRFFLENVRFFLGWQYLCTFFGQKLKFWWKVEILEKSWNFDKKLKFWWKVEIFIKSWNFGEKLKFSSKVKILIKSWNFGQKLKFSVKSWKSVQMFKFWEKWKFWLKVEILSQKLKFLSKVEIFGQKFNFWSKVQILLKSFWSKTGQKLGQKFKFCLNVFGQKLTTPKNGGIGIIRKNCKSFLRHFCKQSMYWSQTFVLNRRKKSNL